MVDPICACSNVTVISDVLKIHAASEYGHKEEGRPVMVERKLDGAVDKSLADRKFINRTRLHNLWRPAPSGTRPYGRQAG